MNARNKIGRPWLALSALAGLAFGVFPDAGPFSAGVRAAARQRQQEQQEEQAAGRRGRIAFASDREDNFEIYTLDPDGGGLSRLTNDPAEDFDPSWSPDGSRVAFVSDRDGQQEIYVIDATTMAETRLTANAAADLDPAWSPDGRRLAFTSERDGNQEVYVMNADGAGLTRLTDSTAADFRPSWSPDGARLAFTSRRDGNDEVYVMNADGSGQTNVSNNPADDLNPAWSPMRITFQTTRDGNDEVYSMNADGSNQTRLTDSPAFDGRPGRSADGSRVAFVSDRDGDLDLYIMNADGSDQRRLTAGEENEFDPDVQPLSAGTPAIALQFAAANFTAGEGAGRVTITVTRVGSADGSATVEYATVGGTASERSDYTSAFGVLRFADGETSKTFNVLLTDDAFGEGEETFSVTLKSPAGAVLGALPTATVTIQDNEAATSSANPIDEAQAFVRQHYLDFLSREPDPAGLAFWTGQITSCGSDQACVARKRVEVSAAFFLSIEFQGTGFLVHRFYVAAFGRVPRFAEFLPDTQRLGEGVVVGQAGASERLEANRREYADRFVAESEAFRALYDGKTNEQYVDALNANAGGSLSPGERNSLVARLNAGIETRATALRVVAEDADLRAREFNRAFVLMQYFGYLRRNPDDPPDADFSGFNFWLGKLNQFGGDFRAAELVKAFITSAEYRRRFGTQ